MEKSENEFGVPASALAIVSQCFRYLGSYNTRKNCHIVIDVGGKKKKKKDSIMVN